MRCSTVETLPRRGGCWLRSLHAAVPKRCSSERASEAGYPSAMFEFGLALFHGKGVARDVQHAADLIRASAQGGNEYAREFLLAYSLDVGT